MGPRLMVLVIGSCRRSSSNRRVGGGHGCGVVRHGVEH
jgi:hypothetical protein